MTPKAKKQGKKVAEDKEVATGEFDPLIIIFACNWCSYSGADLAGTSRYQYSPNVRIIRVMCSGRVDPSLILKALRNGADGVLISGCHPSDCHYISGNEKTEARISFLKRFLPHVGINPNRLRLEWISGSEGELFARIATDFTEQVRELGPNPLVGDDMPEVR
ncbi:MAG: hydrogenase iron-sulfur subunit [Thermoplasmata archaeon]|nr:hydrogenase iron-sulfur subunit [Thermoplasmata archaeon]